MPVLGLAQRPYDGIIPAGRLPKTRKSKSLRKYRDPQPQYNQELRPYPAPALFHPMKTEDTTDRLHLSLINRMRDFANPNPGSYEFDERAMGKGTTVCIINTGYNWEQFPDEFGRPDDPRPLCVWRVPSHIRDRELEPHEIEAGYWIPDDDRDYAEPFEGVPEGHGTQAAMLAGGLRIGVAREAGLYMIKAGRAILDQDGDVVEEDVPADAVLASLLHIVDKLNDGTLIKGKTVVIIDTVWDYLGGMESWTEEVAEILDTLDQLGVVFSISAGNDGRMNPAGETAAKTPNILAAREGSPLIIVGAVNSMGQLVRFSSAGSAAVPINTYAMGKGIKIVDMSIEEDVLQDGTTFSAALVAGVMACYLSHPDFSERFKWTAEDPPGATVGNRLKSWMSTEGQGCYQRVSPDNLLDLTSDGDWSNYPIPSRVNTAYNYSHGSQGDPSESESSREPQTD